MSILTRLNIVFEQTNLGAVSASTRLHAEKCTSVYTLGVNCCNVC